MKKRLVRHPVRISSGLAFVAGVLAVSIVADADVQRQILAIAVASISTFAIGGLVWRRGLSVLGVAAALAGTAGVLFALVQAVTRPAFFTQQIELVPGLLGLWVLVAALVPIRLGWERALVDTGTGLIFVTVLIGGVVQGISFAMILAAGILTILAWDAAENAISVGGQLGLGAPTIRGELVHCTASCVVATGAIGLVYLVNGLGIDELPFTALLALLIAGVALAVASYR